jgi:hypothetical protein
MNDPSNTSPTAWQPIETAPKDGTAILLFSPDARGLLPSIGLWSAGEFPNGEIYADWIDCWADAVIDAEPTHWMHLPPPPIQKEPD